MQEKNRGGRRGQDRNTKSKRSTEDKKEGDKEGSSSEQVEKED